MTIVAHESIEASFETRADLIAAGFVADVGRIAYAGGLAYVRDDAGTALTDSLGQKWSPVHGAGTPIHFGAVGDGVTDDAASIQSWFDYANAISLASGTNYKDPKIILDFGGKAYAISSTVTLNGSEGFVVRDASFVAIGTTWNANKSDYMFVAEVAYSYFDNLRFWCGDLCNGIQDNKGRNTWSKIDCARFTQVGYHKPPDTGPKARLTNCNIRQYRSTDSQFDDETKFTGVGILMQQSDCVVENCTSAWSRSCYMATAGQQSLYNNHFFNGDPNAGSVRTNCELIRWDPFYDPAQDTEFPSTNYPSFGSGSGVGELEIHSLYSDNGYITAYSDLIRMFNCKILVDDNDVNVPVVIKQYASSTVTAFPNPRTMVSNAFIARQWPNDDSTKLIQFLPNFRYSNSYIWPNQTNLDNLKTMIDIRLANTEHNYKIINLNNQSLNISTTVGKEASGLLSADIDCVTSFADNSINSLSSRPRIGGKGNNIIFKAAEGYVDNNALGTAYKVLSTEPLDSTGTVLPVGALAYSDGTASTNGFGGVGVEGLYIKTSTGWKLITTS
jgi:hypothetical protein